MVAGRPFVDPIERPDIIVPDASPLIHLAQAAALHLLHQVGRAVILVDVVVDEVTRDPAKPGAMALLEWIDAGTSPGTNAPVRVEMTETGRAIALARITEPGFSMRNGGENAIVEWLVDELQGTDSSAIVLYENGRVPRVVAAQGIDADIDVVTTRAFLELAERGGLLSRNRPPDIKKETLDTGSSPTLDTIMTDIVSLFDLPPDDSAEREADAAARAEIEMGKGVPHERVREWLLKLRAGQIEPPPAA